jgi:hypothetical protein
MEAAGASESLVTINETVWYHKPANYNLNFHQHKKQN